MARNICVARKHGKHCVKNICNADTQWVKNVEKNCVSWNLDVENMSVHETYAGSCISENASRELKKLMWKMQWNICVPWKLYFKNIWVMEISKNVGDAKNWHEVKSGKHVYVRSKISWKHGVKYMCDVSVEKKKMEYAFSVKIRLKIITSRASLLKSEKCAWKISRKYPWVKIFAVTYI